MLKHQLKQNGQQDRTTHKALHIHTHTHEPIPHHIPGFGSDSLHIICSVDHHDSLAVLRFHDTRDVHKNLRRHEHNRDVQTYSAILERVNKANTTPLSSHPTLSCRQGAYVLSLQSGRHVLLYRTRSHLESFVGLVRHSENVRVGERLRWGLRRRGRQREQRLLYIVSYYNRFEHGCLSVVRCYVG